MKSMTGFGRADEQSQEWRISVEIKTVNHRYRDDTLHMPSILNALELKIKKEIELYISRGRVDVYIQFLKLGSDQKEIELNADLAQAYIHVLNQLKTLDPMMGNEIGVGLVAQFPDVVQVSEKKQDDALNWERLKPVLDRALERVVESRVQDARAMSQDMSQRIEKIKDMMAGISQRAPEMLKQYRQTIYQRVSEFVKDSAIDEGRILTEIAVMADRLDITEEITRMRNHLERLSAFFGENEEPIGRKCDFLIQEMNREINTIGSKSSDLEIQNLVVDVKAEIEKIREQIQNIE
ncbi:YicC/YloC family endoribonuclease [Pseudoramibacter sp.]|jgi:uncharacterized protein (TIGR00255 family)|uniref:YicC/YloC family endoribonuclease n=1 Tax=Pseudoramibacter sp. TaxID=2034862 RepID=UPI0025F3A56A|nr:YicC/YloC family endoribonuclease [Pseudoramibacter sp.]MCH4072714.1 YicC family protein [Pseudoramibacter sp.]MCH4106485.1 YicC family protein [Pseudoramibacter sp.]